MRTFSDYVALITDSFKPTYDFLRKPRVYKTIGAMSLLLVGFAATRTEKIIGELESRVPRKEWSHKDGYDVRISGFPDKIYVRGINDDSTARIGDTVSLYVFRPPFDQPIGYSMDDGK